ncbi:MAG: hypothetical protein R2939_11565 [Kofleriaceae bacterium]
MVGAVRLRRGRCRRDPHAPLRPARAAALDEALRAQYAAEDGTPYPAARERRNVGTFHRTLARRTVGTGGCRVATLEQPYSQAMARPFEPLPADVPPGYLPLREQVNGWLARGGVVGIQCDGGRGRLALMYTADAARPGGYALITIYDDEPPARR